MIKEPYRIFVGDDILDQIQEAEKLGYKEIYMTANEFRDRFETICWLFKEMLDRSDLGKKLRLNEGVTVELKTLSYAINYLINCKSFNSDEYYKFDKDEISRKLKRLK